jgi:hypothetical protein
MITASFLISAKHRGEAFRRASDIALLGLFAALQIADIVTTNAALSRPGVWEANPLMRLFQSELGAAWWLAKVAPVALAVDVVLRLRRYWPMLVVVSYYALTVGNNLRHL